MIRYIKTLLIFGFLLALHPTLHAQAGSLDSSFGVNGLVTYDKTSSNGGSLIQPDGKIVVVSQSWSYIVVWRFNPDGTFDESFGEMGGAHFSYENRIGTPKDIVLQPDGKLVFTAEYHPDQYYYVGIVRCNADGTPDSSFGINGLDTVKIDKFNYESGLVLQPDGKIVVSGESRPNFSEGPNSFLLRLMPNGGLDPTFGNGGIVVTTYNVSIEASGLVLRPDGKLIKGITYNDYAARSSYQLESFNPDGTVDAGFGENGVASYTFGHSGSWSTEMYGIALQQDGKIVCGGISGQNGIEAIALCRFNEDGALDIGFGDNHGSIIVTPKTSGWMLFGSVISQSDGKILVCGTGDEYPTPLFLIRLTQDGNYDPSFGENGISSIGNDSVNLDANQIHNQQDGKILVIGTYWIHNGIILLARYNGDNVLATHFKNVKAVENKEGISISWQTLNESNTQSYTIERSGNAQDYRDIANIPAKGQTENSYNYTDKNPLAGDNYYRIRENARNGTVSYSQTLKVNFIQSGVLSLYPNPAKSTVTVKGLDKNSASVIKIMDMQGREISSQHFDKVSTATLNIRSLAQGAYFIQITQGEKVVRLKMVKE
ncbi:MAG: T9SS type A sorting domain-containing protein [Bacteroidetes bacterium]|nr:T9SS type A sorting domain-containing protein [Bacteroidota bacterium]